MYSTRFTGIGRYVFELTRNLFNIDRKNEYVLFFNGPEYEKFTPPDSRVKKIKVNIPHYSFGEQTKFLKILNAENLDLMHFTHFNAPVFYKKPCVVTIHDLTLSFFPGKKMTSFVHRAAYSFTIKSAVKNAEKIIAVSNNTKEDLIKLLKTPAEKIEVIYEGVDPAFKPAAKTPASGGEKSATGKKKSAFAQKTTATGTFLKPPFDLPYLLYTGVWRSHKNLVNLVKAFHILKTEYNFEGRLVITGRHDPVYAREIIGETLSLQMEDEIIFTGMVDEPTLIGLYQRALVYVFPSLYEGFGLSPLEAMQCGTPVAASSSSCIPEICGKDNALFFDPKDPRDMAEKIFQIISEKSLREKLIAKGLKRVKDFSWEKMAEETSGLYEAVMKNSATQNSNRLI